VHPDHRLEIEGRLVEASQGGLDLAHLCGEKPDPILQEGQIVSGHEPEPVPKKGHEASHGSRMTEGAPAVQLGSKGRAVEAPKVLGCAP
jgi:hypothetical protein